MEAVSLHIQTGLGNGFRSLTALLMILFFFFLIKCSKKVLSYSANYLAF